MRHKITRMHQSIFFHEFFHYTFKEEVHTVKESHPLPYEFWTNNREWASACIWFPTRHKSSVLSNFQHVVLQYVVRPGKLAGFSRDEWQTKTVHAMKILLVCENGTKLFWVTVSCWDWFNWAICYINSVLAVKYANIGKITPIVTWLNRPVQCKCVSRNTGCSPEGGCYK